MLRQVIKTQHSRGKDTDTRKRLKKTLWISSVTGRRDQGIRTSTRSASTVPIKLSLLSHTRNLDTNSKQNFGEGFTLKTIQWRHSNRCGIEKCRFSRSEGMNTVIRYPLCRNTVLQLWQTIPVKYRHAFSQMCYVSGLNGLSALCMCTEMCFSFNRGPVNVKGRVPAGQRKRSTAASQVA